MLTPRLQAIAEMVDQGSKLADIGSDHGYLCIDLVNKKQISYAVASDLNAGPVENLKKTIALHGVSDKIAIRMGNGLGPINANEVDTIAIAGMGGVLISEILLAKKELWEGTTYILQPMTHREQLRAFLLNAGFTFLDEAVAIEGKKFYEIMKVKFVHDNHRDHLLEEDLYLGPKLKEKKDANTKAFYDFLAMKYNNILKSIGDSGKNEEQRKKIEKQLEKVEAIRACL